MARSEIKLIVIGAGDKRVVVFIEEPGDSNIMMELDKAEAFALHLLDTVRTERARRARVIERRKQIVKDGKELRHEGGP